MSSNSKSNNNYDFTSFTFGGVDEDDDESKYVPNQQQQQQRNANNGNTANHSITSYSHLLHSPGESNFTSAATSRRPSVSIVNNNNASFGISGNSQSPQQQQMQKIVVSSPSKSSRSQKNDDDDDDDDAESLPMKRKSSSSSKKNNNSKRKRQDSTTSNSTQKFNNDSNFGAATSFNHGESPFGPSSSNLKDHHHHNHHQQQNQNPSSSGNVASPHPPPTTTTTPWMKNIKSLSTSVLVPNLAHRCILRDPTTRRVRFVPWGGNAAVIFADISGYSKLTSRLAEEGLGATAVADAVNSYFARVIKIVAEHGGEIVKFAGDLCVGVWVASQDAINGHRAAFQALRCAGEIQRSCGSHVISRKVKNSGGNNNNANLQALHHQGGSNHNLVNRGPSLKNLKRGNSGSNQQTNNNNNTTTKTGSGEKEGQQSEHKNTSSSSLARVGSLTSNQIAAFAGSFRYPNNNNNNITNSKSNSNQTENIISNNNNNSSDVDSVTLHLHIGVAYGELHAEVLSPPASSEGVRDVLPRGFFICSGPVLQDAGDACTESPNGTICITPELLKSIGPTIGEMLRWEASSHGTMHLITDINQPVLRGKQSIDPHKLFNNAKRDEDVEVDFISPQLLKRLSHGLTVSDAMETRDVVVLFLKKIPASASTPLWFRDVSMILARYHCPILQVIDDEKGVHVVACLNLFVSEPNACDLAVEMARRVCEDVCGAAIGIARGFALCGLVGDIGTCARSDIHGEVVVRACRMMEYASSNFAHELLPFGEMHSMNFDPDNLQVAIDISVVKELRDKSQVRIVNKEVQIKGTTDPQVVYSFATEVKIRYQGKGTDSGNYFHSMSNIFGNHQQQNQNQKPSGSNNNNNGGAVAARRSSSKLFGSTTFGEAQETFGSLQETLRANYGSVNERAVSPFPFSSFQNNNNNNDNNTNNYNMNIPNNQFMSGIEEFSTDVSKLLASICSVNRFSYSSTCRNVERQEFRDDYIFGHNYSSWSDGNNNNSIASNNNNNESNNVIINQYLQQQQMQQQLLYLQQQQQNYFNGFNNNNNALTRITSGNNNCSAPNEDNLPSYSFAGSSTPQQSNLQFSSTAAFLPQTSPSSIFASGSSDLQGSSGQLMAFGEKRKRRSSIHQFVAALDEDEDDEDGEDSTSTNQTRQGRNDKNANNNNNNNNNNKPTQHAPAPFSSLFATAGSPLLFGGGHSQQNHQQQQPFSASDSQSNHHHHHSHNHHLPPPMQLALISSCPLAGKKSLALSSCHWNGLTPIMHRASKSTQHNILHTIAAWFCFHSHPTLRAKARRCVSAFNKESLSFVVATLTLELIEAALQHNVRVAMIVDHAEFLDEVSLLFIRTAMQYITERERKKDVSILPTEVRRKSMVMQSQQSLVLISSSSNPVNSKNNNNNNLNQIKKNNNSNSENENNLFLGAGGSLNSFPNFGGQSNNQTELPVPPLIARRRRESFMAQQHKEQLEEQEKLEKEKQQLQQQGAVIARDILSFSGSDISESLQNKNKNSNDSGSPFILSKEDSSCSNNQNNINNVGETVIITPMKISSFASPFAPLLIPTSPPSSIATTNPRRLNSFSKPPAQNNNKNIYNHHTASDTNVLLKEATTLLNDDEEFNHREDSNNNNEQKMDGSYHEDKDQHSDHDDDDDSTTNESPNNTINGSSPVIVGTSVGGFTMTKTSSFHRNNNNNNNNNIGGTGSIIIRGSSFRNSGLRTKATGASGGGAMTPNPFSSQKSVNFLEDFHNSNASSLPTFNNKNDSNTSKNFGGDLPGLTKDLTMNVPGVGIIPNTNANNNNNLFLVAGSINSGRASAMTPLFTRKNNNDSRTDSRAAASLGLGFHNHNNNNGGRETGGGRSPLPPPSHSPNRQSQQKSASSSHHLHSNNQHQASNNNNNIKASERKQWLWILCHTPIYDAVGETHLQTLVVGSSQQSVKTIKLKEMSIEEEVAVVNNFVEAGENLVEPDSNFCVLRRLSNGCPGATLPLMKFFMQGLGVGVEMWAEYYPKLFEEYSQGVLDYKSKKYHLNAQDNNNKKNHNGTKNREKRNSLRNNNSESPEINSIAKDGNNNSSGGKIRKRESFVVIQSEEEIHVQNNLLLLQQQRQENDEEQHSPKENANRRNSIGSCGSSEDAGDEDIQQAFDEDGNAVIDLSTATPKKSNQHHHNGNDDDGNENENNILPPPPFTKEQALQFFNGIDKTNGHTILSDHAVQSTRFLQWATISRSVMSATDSMTDELAADLLIIVKVASLIYSQPEDTCPVELVAQIAAGYLKVEPRSLFTKFDHLRALYFFEFALSDGIRIAKLKQKFPKYFAEKQRAEEEEAEEEENRLLMKKNSRQQAQQQRNNNIDNSKRPSQDLHNNSGTLQVPGMENNNNNNDCLQNMTSFGNFQLSMQSALTPSPRRTSAVNIICDPDEKTNHENSGSLDNMNNTTQKRNSPSSLSAQRQQINNNNNSNTVEVSSPNPNPSARQQQSSSTSNSSSSFPKLSLKFKLSPLREQVESRILPSMKEDISRIAFEYLRNKFIREEKPFYSSLVMLATTSDDGKDNGMKKPDEVKSPSPSPSLQISGGTNNNNTSTTSMKRSGSSGIPKPISKTEFYNWCFFRHLQLARLAFQMKDIELCRKMLTDAWKAAIDKDRECNNNKNSVSFRPQNHHHVDLNSIDPTRHALGNFVMSLESSLTQLEWDSDTIARYCEIFEMPLSYIRDDDDEDEDEDEDEEEEEEEVESTQLSNGKKHSKGGPNDSTCTNAFEELFEKNDHDSSRQQKDKNAKIKSEKREPTFMLPNFMPLRAPKSLSIKTPETIAATGFFSPIALGPISGIINIVLRNMLSTRFVTTSKQQQQDDDKNNNEKRDHNLALAESPIILPFEYDCVTYCKMVERFEKYVPQAFFDDSDNDGKDGDEDDEDSQQRSHSHSSHRNSLIQHPVAAHSNSRKTSSSGFVAFSEEVVHQDEDNDNNNQNDEAHSQQVEKSAFSSHRQSVAGDDAEPSGENPFAFHQEQEKMKEAKRKVESDRLQQEYNKKSADEKENLEKIYQLITNPKEILEHDPEYLETTTMKKTNCNPDLENETEQLILRERARTVAEKFRPKTSELSQIRCRRIERLMKKSYAAPPDLRSPRVRHNERFARHYNLLARAFDLLKFTGMDEDERNRIEMSFFANGATEGLKPENEAVRGAFVVLGVEDFSSPYPYQTTSQLRDFWFSGELPTVELKAFIWLTLLLFDVIFDRSFEG